MSRKPRVITDADVNRPDNLPYDVRMWPNADICFFNGTRLKHDCTIDKDKTRPHANPLDYFSEIIANSNDVAIFLEIDAEHEYVREKYPWVSPFCDSIRICPKFGILCVIYHAHTDQLGYGPTVRCDPAEFQAAIDDQTRVLDFANEDRSDVLMMHSYDLFVSVAADMLLKNGDCAEVFNSSRYPITWVQPKRNAREVRLCRFNVKRKQKYRIIRLLTMTKDLSLCDWYVSRSGYSFEHVRNKGQYTFYHKEIPNDDAPLSTLYYVEQILDAAIGLLPVLPPYVVLWIVDLLPKIRWLSGAKKIRLIEDVRDSMNRIRVKKNLEPYWVSYDI